jgi:tyrosine recombinase XerC
MENSLLKLKQDYLRYLRSVRTLSERSIEAYNLDIDHFLHFLMDRNEQTLEIEPREVRMYVGRLRDFFAASTTSRMLSSVRGFYRYAVKTGQVENNPFDAVRGKGRSRRLPEVLGEREVGDLLEMPEDGFIGARDRLIMEFFYSTGARVSEAVGMDMFDIDKKRKTVRLRGKGDKERYAYLGSDAMDALESYLPYRRERVSSLKADAGKALFLNARGERLTRRGVGFILKKYQQRLATGRRIHPHLFRHSFATHLLDRGADIRSVQELLGHADLSTTGIYTHVSLKRLQDVYRKAHPHNNTHGTENKELKK